MKIGLLPRAEGSIRRDPIRFGCGRRSEASVTRR